VAAVYDIMGILRDSKRIIFYLSEVTRAAGNKRITGTIKQVTQHKLHFRCRFLPVAEAAVVSHYGHRRQHEDVVSWIYVLDS